MKSNITPIEQQARREERYIPARVLAAAKARHEEIERQKHMLHALELELQMFVGAACGVDTFGETWNLNLDEGVLTRDAAPTDASPGDA